MSEPVDYIPRTVPSVSAMYMGPGSENIDDIIDWITPLLPSPAYVSNSMMGTASVVDGGFDLQFKQNDYVYLDEDGLHAIDKGTFELLFSPDV